MGLIGIVGDAVVVRTVGAGVGIVGLGVGIVGAGVGIVGRDVLNVGGLVGCGGGVGLVLGNGGIFGFVCPGEVGLVVGRGVGTGNGNVGALVRRVVGAGVLMYCTGDGVTRTVGKGVGIVGAGVGIVGAGVGIVGAGVGIVGAGVIMTGTGTVGLGVTGGAAGIAPADPAGAHGIPGEFASNFTSQPIHAPGAQVNDIKATSYPVINWVLTHELYPEQSIWWIFNVLPCSLLICMVASRPEDRPDIVMPANSVMAGTVPRSICMVTFAISQAPV